MKKQLTNNQALAITIIGISIMILMCWTELTEGIKIVIKILS